RIRRRERCVMSVPRRRIVPEVGSVSRRTQFATVVLPLPDSPTRPRISPRASSNETPSTACTVPRLPPTRPPTWKCLTRSSTSRIGPLSSGALIGQPSVGRSSRSVLAGMEAGDPVLGPHLAQLGNLRPRQLVGPWAAVGERACARKLAQRRDPPRDLL